ncbi:hypothetical protein [Silanimonas sp.]|jgi:uncharacterized membrane protein|uniref:BufA2 family periplasmic bufferin-type metallophore n=1 Tax=Silanimonas sp. TaxID=1929290 RepID=UPI0022CA0536|nr:hypothetical protein [Silanimonas sp.]MCZ8116137.1 hypothetical protein [Silanimonas sp.]
MKTSLSLAAFAAAFATSFAALAADAPQGSSGAAVAAGDTIHCYGITSCKGQNDCKTTEHACKGNAECAGHGFKATTAKECLNQDGTIGDIAA